jgi:hypothetical protein
MATGISVDMYRFPKRVGIVFVQKRKKIYKINIKNFLRVLNYKIKEKASDKKLPSLDFSRSVRVLLIGYEFPTERIPIANH